jgi:hypothetical protein
VNRRGNVVFPLLIAAAAVLVLPKTWLADTPLYQEVLTPLRLRYVTAPMKLLFLLSGSVLAWRAARSFGSGNPSAQGWTLMSVGLGVSGVAQAVLTWYQIVAGGRAPFPSMADPLFVVGMLLLVASLVRLLFAFLDAELPLASRRQAATVAGLSALTMVALGVFLLRPVLAHPAPPLEQALNVAYPLLDCLMLVPTLVLARITSRLRGGHVHRVWTLMLGGFLATAAGDVLFAYFATLGMEGLDPLVDVLYLASYGLWAWGTAVQLEVVAAGDRSLAPVPAAA